MPFACFLICHASMVFELTFSFFLFHHCFGEIQAMPIPTAVEIFFLYSLFSKMVLGFCKCLCFVIIA